MNYTNPYPNPAGTARYGAPYYYSGRGGVAVVEGTSAGPFNLANADTLNTRLTVGAVTNATATITAARAGMTSNSIEPFALDGTSLTLRFSDNAADNVTVNFAGGDPWSTADVMAAINASGVAGGFATEVSGSLSLASDVRGTAARAVVSGTALAAFDFTATSATGSGNVANVDQVTAAEVVGVAQAAADAVPMRVRYYVTADGRVGVHSLDEGSGVSLQILATSTIDDELGFDNDPVDGTDPAEVLPLRVGPRSAALPLPGLLGGGS